MPINSHKNFILLLILISFSAAILSFISPAVAIGFFLLEIFILLAAQKPIWLIYGLTLYMPFEPFALKFANDNFFLFLKYGLEIGIFILFTAVAGKLFLHRLRNNNLLKKEFIKTPIDKPLLIFITITAISAIANLTGPIYWILGLRQIFRFTLLYYTIIYLNPAKKQIKTIIIILLFLLAIQSAIGIGQALIGKSADQFLIPDKVREIGEITTSDFVEQSWSSGQRIFATMGRYDKLGTFLCLAILISFGFFLETKDKKIKKIFLLLIIFALPALILTYSRMSWLGAAIGICFVGIIIKKNKLIAFLTAIMACLFLIYIISYISNNNLIINRIIDKKSMGVGERFLMLFSATEFKGSYKGYGRFYFIINTPLKVIKKYPVIGVGLGRYGSGVSAALGSREIYNELNIAYGIQNYLGSIDNNWFSLWGETGTLGIISFIWIIASLFIFTYKFYKTTNDNFSKGLALGFLAVILAVSLQGFLGQYFEVRPLSFYFWLLGGAVVSLEHSLCVYCK
ncbi:MAG: O-antigen ligase family protein [bacterium]